MCGTRDVWQKDESSYFGSVMKVYSRIRGIEE